MAKVTLAVRVRPFSERELKQEKWSEPVVRVEDEHTVSITNLKVATSGAGDSRLRVRRYNADFCLDGSCEQHHPNYASQEKVYETVGRTVLETVDGGHSACVLAYGQSATGKTHTMLGTPEQPGLVPRLCRHLADGGAPLTVSFLEIYNERVRDLLCEEVQGAAENTGYNSLPRRRGNTVKDLRVREHPTKGPYVQNLRRVVVRGAEALLTLVWTGAARRRTAATRRNPVSSRSHAVLQLSIGAADLHLADLAGSEKAGLEGSYRGRQKEGANINKSLVALSNVISALVCGGGGGGGGGGRGRYVPYRDSALTWLLKDCFTGGAATFLIATLSPSSSCYGESASTLRWAARARQLPAPRGAIKTSSARAQTATSEQLATLRAALLKHHIQFIPETGALVHDPKFWILKMRSNEDMKSVHAEEATERATHASHKVPTSESNQFGSTASSITSTSSDRLDEKHMKAFENKENPIDHIFGPVLERTVSGHDLKVTAPLRNKRKQYRSHDVLPIVTRPKLITLSNSNSSQVDIPGTNNNEDENMKVKSEEGDKQDAPKIHVPYQIDNQRAEIVASVTERLYSKLKKNEDPVASKVESAIDKKIMEPLHELKICTNARQRLVEMSQRAFRSRRKIGIPAYTQTRMRVTRMKDKAIDVQGDLEPYCIKYDNEYKYYLSVHTETHPFSQRCKDVAVGSAVGSLYCRDVAVSTDPAPVCISNFVMTEDLHKSDNSTQTDILTPPRKRKLSAFTKYLAPKDSSGLSDSNKDVTNSSIISISISQTYPKEAESLSDDSLDACTNGSYNSKKNMPPDLLSNHNSVDHDNQLNPTSAIECHRAIIKSSTANTIDNISSGSFAGHLKPLSSNVDIANPIEIHTNRSGVKNSTDGRLITDKSVNYPLEELFSDNDESRSLPRSSGDTKLGSEDLKNMILGRNSYVYPYNIAISPPLSRLDKIDSSKKAVTFADDLAEFPKKAPLLSIGTQTSLETKYMEDSCRETSSENVSSVDSDDFNEPAKTSYNPRLRHSCSFSYVDGLSNHRPNCNANTLGVRRKSDLSIPNLKSSNLYKPTYRPRSSSYQAHFKSPLSESEPFKQFLFDSRINSLTSTSVTSEQCDQSDVNRCMQSPTSMSYLSDDYSDYSEDFKDKKKFFEEEIKRIHGGTHKYHKGFNYYAYGSEIMRSCDQLEKSIVRHENYIVRLNRRRTIDTRATPKYSDAARAPSAYLQHLIQVRRNVVDTAKLNEDASFHSFHGYV